MKIEFKDSIIVGDREEDILIDGEKAGKMHFYAASKDRLISSFHAVLNVRCGAISLLQGHGETREEALLNALRDGKRDAHVLLETIAALEKKFCISDQPGRENAA